MVKYIGTAASGGLTVAKIKIINRRITGFKRVVLATHREKALFDAAVILAKDELRQLMETSDKEHKDILNFQLVMLDDNGMNELILGKIDLGMGAALAVEEAMEEYCRRIKSIKDGYLSERASDIRDVLTRVVDILDGRSRERFVLTEPVIIVADEILPSDLATIDRDLAMGFITVGGSYQSHAIIIARTMGIPSVCCVDSEILNPLFAGKTVALDGYSGEVFLSPSEATLALFNHKMNLEKRDTVSAQALKSTPVIHSSGTEIFIYANCNDPKDITLAINNGAQGIGLVRSEILFMSKNYDLSIPCQISFYSGCILASQGKPITIRTYDIGADKPLGTISQEKEPNPALGVRGVRLIYAHRQLFCDQIEALFIAADRCGKINVMIPMVSMLKDVTDYMELVAQVRDRLFAQKVISQDNIVWGVMIETPAAALISDELAQCVSFFSIGTNDLTQYTLAADRINSGVAAFYNPVHRSVIKLIAMTVENAKAAGIPVSICGESAADFESAKIYIDLGIRCLSMAQNAMLPIKQ
ncbi:MAG: phosphoenolpyruvate--protein phosphotransferase, partial [Oscillospiraceae bacterium]